MSRRYSAVIGACLAALGVLIGAFGAHGLPKLLEKRAFDASKIEQRIEQCDTAVEYHLLHATATVVVGMTRNRRRGLSVAIGLWLVGIAAFSGGIFGLVFFEWPTHYFAPIGGLSFIIGWLVLAVSLWREPELSESRSPS
jgi:uncharacterized membrane protein YgdD (TMEM256/DUF423 family)